MVPGRSFHIPVEPRGSGNRVLAIHPGALGDVVLTFPILAHLRERGDAIHLLCQGKIGRVAVHLKIAHRSYALEERWTSALFARPLDSRILEWLNQFSTILVFSRTWNRDELAAVLPHQGLFCVPPRPALTHRLHVTRFLWTALRDQGLQLSQSPPDPRDRAPGWDLWKGRNRVAHPGANAKIIALHPGSGSFRKNLPLECWLETASILEERKYTPAWVLGPAEKALAAQVARQGLEGRHLWIMAELPTLCGKLEWVAGFIGHDSGLSHLAAFIGVPVLALFGPSDPRRWQPWGPRVRVLRADLPCRPCFEIETRNCPEETCRTVLTAPTIVGAWQRWEGDLLTTVDDGN